MSQADQHLVRSLWLDGLLHVLIATPDLAYGTREVDFCAPLVIIKGTERYNGAKQCFEAYRQSAVLQMIGRAARRQARSDAELAAKGGTDKKVTVVVMCQVRCCPLRHAER